MQHRAERCTRPGTRFAVGEAAGAQNKVLFAADRNHFQPNAGFPASTRVSTNDMDRSIGVIDPRRVSAPVFLGKAPVIEKVRNAAERVARGDAKVLITGESGVGKDVLGRYLHAHSTRASNAFVALNCAGISETLLESELFGHVKGSFTGAHRDKVGKLQLANRGTVFLDEIGEMSLRMQALLLRFLENGEIQPVGADTPAARVDVRVISATNRNLPEMVAAGAFREDLMYRIKVVHLHVPPLRERAEDIRSLIDHAIERTQSGIRIDEDAMQVLERYRWPGNVRELQNVIEQLAWLGTDGQVGVSDLPPSLLAAAPPTILRKHDRRRQVADDLFQTLVAGTHKFWDHVYTLFLNRDITRHDVRELVRRGLAATSGNYRAMLHLFGIEAHDYKRFLNFLAAHDCSVDFRQFRTGAGRRADTQPVAVAAAPAAPRIPEAGRLH
jgi:DNA-binding NtrC family response regulator